MHNETSTGVTSSIPDVRAAIDRARHPALYMVDTISSLASIDYRHDEWRVDVTVAGSQKGLMLPPGLSFNAVSAKALAAAKTARLPRSYWDWSEMIAINPSGFFPYTPATNLLYGLAAALDMLFAEGLDQVFARHDRLAEATRRAVNAWGLEILCADPALYSSTLTGVMMPEGHDADAFRKVVLERFDMSLGQGLGKVAGQDLSHRPPRAFQRADALRNARRGRDGTGGRRRSAPEGRRPGGDRLSRRDRPKVGTGTCRRQELYDGHGWITGTTRVRALNCRLAHHEENREMNKFVNTAGALAIMLAHASAVAWEPTKPVEIVVAAGAGGASDQMARMMQAAIQKNNLMKQPMIVSLKGGASGAEALMYMKSSEGDPNKVLVAYSLIYMLPLAAKIPFNWRDLSPVSVIAMDQFVLWDNVTLPYKSVKEFVTAAKAADPPFKMGGTGSKREDHVLTVFMEKKTGAKFAYLPYKSGGEAATQLVGNHTAANVNNPSENLEVWRAGQVRALCVFDKERIAYRTKVTDTQSWNDIPTCKEEGLDVQYLMLRAMFLPGKVTPEQTAFYVDLFRKLTQTAEYKDYMEKQALKPVFLTGKDMLAFLEEDDKLNKGLMTEAGFVAP